MKLIKEMLWDVLAFIVVLLFAAIVGLLLSHCGTF